MEGWRVRWRMQIGRELMRRIVCAIFLVVVTQAIALGQAPERIYCKYCHHWMTQKKDWKHFVAVRVKPEGPTYYCCRCGMPKKWLVKKAARLEARSAKS